MADEIKNEIKDVYEKRETGDRNEDASAIDYGPPDAAPIEQVEDGWIAQRGESAQQDFESCLWLVQNFCPEKIEALSDPRNLSHDLELGADLISIYSEAMDKMEQEDKGLNYQTVTQQQPNSRQQVDIRQKVEMAIFSAEQRHAARSSRYSK